MNSRAITAMLGIGCLLAAGRLAAEEIQVASIPDAGIRSLAGSAIAAPEPVSPVSLIHSGMTRAEVEALLPVRDGGPQGLSSTRYYQAGRVIEVPYDQTGGTWAPTNRVVSSIQSRPGSRSTF